MKNFSKLISIIICVAMLLSVLVIVGCNNNTPGNDDETTDYVPPVEDNKFTLGLSVEGYPYAYTKDDKLEGVCVDVVAAIMNDMEKELELKIADKNKLVENLIAGEYTGILLDTTSAYEIDPLLLQQIECSNVIVTSRQVVLTTADSDIARITDLDGKKIGALKGTNNEIALKEKYSEDNISIYSANADGLSALKDGTIDAYIVDFTSVKDLSFTDEGLKLLASDFSYIDYAIWFLTKDAQILSSVNDSVVALNDTHKIEAICNEYLLEAKQ